MPTISDNSSQPSFLTTYTNELSKVGSDVATATKETLKVLSRVSLATAGLLITLWNGVSQTTAKSGEILNQGYQMVNHITGGLPVIGTLITGVGNVLAGVTDTFSTNSKFGNEHRFQYINNMRLKLNDFKPESKTTTSSSAVETTKTTTTTVNANASVAEVKPIPFTNSASV